MRERRYGFEKFACGPGIGLEALERLTALQFTELARQIVAVELAAKRLERRVWLAVVAVILVAGVEGYSLIAMAKAG